MYIITTGVETGWPTQQHGAKADEAFRERICVVQSRAIAHRSGHMPRVQETL